MDWSEWCWSVRFIHSLSLSLLKYFYSHCLNTSLFPNHKAYLPLFHLKYLSLLFHSSCLVYFLVCACFGATQGSKYCSWSLALAWHLGITTGEVLGLVGMLGIDLGWLNARQKLHQLCYCWFYMNFTMSQVFLSLFSCFIMQSLLIVAVDFSLNFL